MAREPLIPYHPLTGPAMRTCLLFIAGILIAQRIDLNIICVYLCSSVFIFLFFLCVLLNRHDTLATLAATAVMVCAGMAAYTIAADIHQPVEIPTETPESPAVTIPFTLPEEFRPPAPTTEGGLSLDEQANLQSQLAQLQREQLETRQIQQGNRQATAIQDEIQALVNLGMDSEWAKMSAARTVSAQLKGEEGIAEQIGINESEIARHRSARDVGKEFNVDPSELLEFNTPTDQRRQAQWIARFNASDKKVEAVQRNQVPDQKFADGGQGTQSVTSDNIDALWVGWENNNRDPAAVNPYNDRYRKFLTN